MKKFIVTTLLIATMSISHTTSLKAAMKQNPLVDLSSNIQDVQNFHADACSKIDTVLKQNKPDPSALLDVLSSLYDQLHTLIRKNPSNLLSQILFNQLHQAGISLIQIRDQQQQTILHKACIAGNLTLIPTILSASASRKEEYLNFILFKDAAGETGSDRAAEHGHHNISGPLTLIEIKQSQKG